MAHLKRIFSVRHSPHLDLSSSSSTIKLTDFILLCANNWLDELPELMRALRDAIHSSIVDCQSVQVIQYSDSNYKLCFAWVISILNLRPI